MPETITSTDITTFVAKTTMKSSEHNTHMDVLRGTRVPISSATSGSEDQVSDLGNTSHRWLRVYGSSIEPVDSTSGTLTLTNKMANIFCDLTTTVTHTLPTAVGITGKTYTFKKIINNTVAWTIDGDGTETIDATTSVAITGFNESKKLVSDGANWQTAGIVSGNLNHLVYLSAPDGHGSTDTKIRSYGTVTTNTGSPYMTLAQTAANGDTITITKSGFYFTSMTDERTGGGHSVGISLDSSSLTTGICGIDTSDRLALAEGAAGIDIFTCWSGYIASGGVIRPHTSGGSDGTAGRHFFRINLIGGAF